MGRYLHYFDTQADFIDAYKNEYEEPWVSCVSGDSSVEYNFPKYVDLGLPSRTIWQTMNVGATNPYDPGYEFKWGETVPSTSANTYIFGNSAPYTKYNPTDEKSVLELVDDAAFAAYDGDDEWYASVPTVQQMLELRNNCTVSYDMGNNLVIYTSKKNGRRIVFPGKVGKTVLGKPDIGIWTSTINSNYAAYGRANALLATAESRTYSLSIDPINRYELHNIRGVLNPVLK